MALLSQNPTKRLIANNGSDSKVNALLGMPGGNVVVKVPVGISLYRDDGKYLGENIFSVFFFNFKLFFSIISKKNYNL